MKAEPKLKLNNDKYYWTQRPDIQKVYTTKEVAELLGITEASVRGIVKNYDLDFSVVPTKSSRAACYSYDTVRQIKEYHEATVKRFEKIRLDKMKAMQDQSMSTEDMKRLHPLVTDERYFKLSYFPDVVPECFKECEE